MVTIADCVANVKQAWDNVYKLSLKIFRKTFAHSRRVGHFWLFRQLGSNSLDCVYFLLASQLSLSCILMLWTLPPQESYSYSKILSVSYIPYICLQGFRIKNFDIYGFRVFRSDLENTVLK